MHIWRPSQAPTASGYLAAAPRPLGPPQQMARRLMECAERAQDDGLLRNASHHRPYGAGVVVWCEADRHVATPGPAAAGGKPTARPGMPVRG